MRFRRIKTTGPQKIGLILIFVGLVCFGIIFSFKAYQQSILSFSEVPELKEETSEDLFPTQILIPKVRIALPIFPAKARGETWEISEEGASFLRGSGIPGQPGNMVIYGHNKNRLLGPIRWLEAGDQVKITNRQKEEFIYEVVETKVVSPQNIEVLSDTAEAILTLYTCTGFLERQRFIVVARLKVN